MTDTQLTAVTRWFLVATKPRAEALAKQHLERQGYGVCAPQLRVKKRQRGTWRGVIEPLFPGYVFVQLTLGADDPAPIRSTVGCRGLVRFGGIPLPVPEGTMQPFLEADAQPSDLTRQWQPGDVVRIEEGPLAGLEAVFAMAKGQDRVEVLLQALGSQQRLIVSPEVLSLSEG